MRAGTLRFLTAPDGGWEARSAGLRLANCLVEAGDERARQDPRLVDACCALLEVSLCVRTAGGTRVLGGSRVWRLHADKAGDAGAATGGSSAQTMRGLELLLCLPACNGAVHLCSRIERVLLLAQSRSGNVRPIQKNN